MRYKYVLKMCQVDTCFQFATKVIKRSSLSAPKHCTRILYMHYELLDQDLKELTLDGLRTEVRMLLANMLGILIVSSTMQFQYER